MSASLRQTKRLTHDSPDMILSYFSVKGGMLLMKRKTDNQHNRNRVHPPRCFAAEKTLTSCKTVSFKMLTNNLT